LVFLRLETTESKPRSVVPQATFPALQPFFAPGMRASVFNVTKAQSHFSVFNTEDLQVNLRLLSIK
jgi:hypothetical protein